MKQVNFTLVFDLGFEKAYLTRRTDCRGRVFFERSKEYEFGSYEFKTVAAFKASYKRYTDKYGYPVKTILNGAHIEGYQAEEVANFIINEAL